MARHRISDRRNPVWRVAGSLLSITAMVVALASVSTDASAEGTPVVTVTKTLAAPGPFNPEQDFTYNIQYACSSLETACPGATLTDLIPPQVSFVSNTTTSTPSTITYDPGSSTLNIVFTSVVDSSGTQGLVAGTTGQLSVTVKFPAGTADGTTAHNCANITATGATEAQSCVDAQALTTPTYGVSLDKSYTVPFTGLTATSGVQGAVPISTVDLSATVGGNQPATSVTVVDPDPNVTANDDPFNSFNLTGFPTLSLPTGVRADIQVKTTGGYSSIAGGPFKNGDTPFVPSNAADVTGVQVIYTNADGSPIAAGTTLDVKVGVQLRDALRSDSKANVPVGTVSNQALATAAYKGAADQTATDTADYTVVAQSTTVNPSKTISPVKAQEKSGDTVTMTAGGKNAGNVPATGMTVTDGGSGGSTWANTFTFTGFTALGSMPSGVTAQVLVYSGGSWHSLGSALANGATPSLGDIAPTSVVGVQWVYSGAIPAGTQISNAFTTTLNDNVKAQTISNANCASATMTTNFGTGASQIDACANFTVTPIQESITGAKSFKPASGVAQTGPTTTVTLSGKNTSNVALNSFELVDPGTGSGATFDSFDFAGFGAITAPSGTTWTVEAYDGTSWHSLSGSPYAAGSTPQSADLPFAADDVLGVRYTLASGSIPADATALSTSIDLQLRDTKRSTSTAIDSGDVKNCTTVSSDNISDESACATYTITPTSPGTGSGASKSISPSTVVQGTGVVSTVDLTAANNDANVPANTVVVEDSPATSTSTPGFWDAFDFDGFTGTIGMPTGTTNVKVEYHTSAGWTTIGTYPSAPSASTLNAGLTFASIDGVRYTWTGIFPAKTTGFNGSFKATLSGSTAAGTYENCAAETFDGAQYTPPKLCASLTVVAQTHTVDQSKTFDPATGTLGLTPPASTTATLQVQNNSNVPVDSIVVTDPDSSTTPFNQFNLTGFGTVTLPSKVQVRIQVSTDGGASYTNVGTYTNGQTVAPSPWSSVAAADVTSVQLTYSGVRTGQIPAKSAVMSVGLQLQLRSTIRGRTDSVTTTAVQNCFTTTSDNGVTFTGDPCATFTPQAQSPGVSAGKTWIPGSGIRDQLPSSSITIEGRNSGNVPVNSLVLQDPATVVTPPAVATSAFDAFNITGFSGLVPPAGANQVQLDVLTADGTWHDGLPAASLPTGGTVNGVALGDIVGVRATFSNSAGTELPVVSDATKTGNVGIDVTLRATLRSTGKPIAVPPARSATVDNQSSALVVYNGTPGTPATAGATYTITSGSVRTAPAKTLYPNGAPTTVNPNQTLIYQLQIQNTGTRKLIAPIVLDKYNPAQLTYDPTQAYPAGQYKFVANGSSLTGTGMTVDSSTPGELKFEFADGDYLAPGQTAYLRVVMTTEVGLPAGTSVTNTYGITWDTATNGAVACTSGSSNTFDGNDTWCTASQTVKVQTADGMSSVKWIKGENAFGFSNVADPTNTSCPVTGTSPDLYTHYPCIAHTVVNGVFDYNLDVTVSGNVPMDAARAIDVLPHVGDTGVLLTGQQRGTAWTPTFLGPVTVTGLPADATYTLYYSDTYTPSTVVLTSPAAPTTWGSDWSTTDFGTDTKAIGIDVQTLAGAPLPPASTIQLHWQMTAPPVSPGVGAIAWNSFAFTGHPTDGSGWLLAAEPRKVGIDLANPSVTITKTATGGDGSFQFTLTPVAPAGKAMAHNVSTTNGTGSYVWGPPNTVLTPGGTYKLAETEQAGWASQFTSCVNNGAALTPISADADSVTFVAPPDGAIDCAFTNTKQPVITVNKTAVGASGDFAFMLTPTDPAGSPVTKDVTVSKDGTNSVAFGPDGLTPGAYTLVETGQGDWVSDVGQCVLDGKPIGQTLTDGRIGVEFTASAGDNISCSFTNTKRPGVTVTKTATGASGTFAFTLTPTAPAQGGGPINLQVSAGGTATYTWSPAGLTPGGTYTLAETPQSGWISMFQQCTGVTPTASTATSVTFIAGAGAEISCAFNNTARPQIAIEKTTQGDDSGAFPFVLEGPGGSTANVSVANGSGMYTWGPSGLEPGTYSLYEDTTGSSGTWTSRFLQCYWGDGTIPTTPIPDKIGVSFKVAAGQDILCTFVNAKRPKITVTKVAAGGDGTFQFTLTPIDPAGNALMQQVTTTNGNGSYTWAPAELTPGTTYTLAETPQFGWSSQFKSCTGIKPSSQTTSSVTFVADAGADVNCTFANTFVPPPPPPTPQTVSPAVLSSQCVSLGGNNAINVTVGDVTGIVYTITGNGTDKVTVAAEAQPGFTLTVPTGWIAVGANSASITITPGDVICVAGTSSEIAPPTSTSPSSVAPTRSNHIEVLPTSQSVTPQGPKQMAYTGVDTVGMGLLALLLLGGGAVALGLAGIRRRKPRRH